MSLRIKIILLFLVSALFGAGYIFLYWMPKTEQAFVQNLSEATERELGATAEMLISPMLQNQLALIHESLAALVDRYPHWVSLELIDDAGRRLFPLGVPPGAESGQHTIVLDMGFRGGSIGTLSLVVDLSEDIKALREQNVQLLGILFGGFLFILLVSVALIDVFVSRPVGKLSHAAVRLASGDFDGELPIPGNDEIGDLVNSFASMRMNIHHSQERLKKAGAELKVSEARFRDFGASASDWYWEKDENLRFSYFSKRFTAMTGVEQDVLLGKTRQKTGNPGASDEDWRRHLKTLDMHESFRGFIHRRVKPDGSAVWLSTNGRPVFDADGNFQGYRGTGLDITDKVNAENALRNAKEDAEQASKAKSEFLASMSHEIRTPMAGIMGFADMLLEDDLAEDSREKVFQIKDSTQSLLTLLNEILDMSKMESGKMEFEHIDFHFPTLVDDAQAMFTEKRKDSRRKNLKIKVDIDDEVPQAINSDPTRLRQILINLIGNAVKFTEKGGVTIEAALTRSDADEEMLRFAVKDTGIGIEQESVSKLFSDFTQADASISRRYQGSGLGLSICKRIVDLMGGEIGVESQIGKGSTFWFTLPYVAAATEVHKRSATTQAVNFRTLRPLRILAAEDNSMNQRIITATMQAYGHHIEVAEDGAKAVEAHKAGDFDLILMDIRMPVMSGTDATRMIRQMQGDKGSIPIVALTADAMTENKRSYIEAGMDEVVTKPIDRAELLEAINRAMREEIHTHVEEEVMEARQEATSPTQQGERDDIPEELDGDVVDFLNHLKEVADGLG